MLLKATLLKELFFFNGWLRHISKVHERGVHYLLSEACQV